MSETPSNKAVRSGGIQLRSCSMENSPYTIAVDVHIMFARENQLTTAADDHQCIGLIGLYFLRSGP